MNIITRDAGCTVASNFNLTERNKIKKKKKIDSSYMFLLDFFFLLSPLPEAINSSSLMSQYASLHQIYEDINFQSEIVYL